MGLKKRRKQLKKKIESLNKQIEKHVGFVKHRKGKLDTTKDYWLKEIGKFQEEMDSAKEKLKKLEK